MLDAEGVLPNSILRCDHPTASAHTRGVKIHTLARCRVGKRLSPARCGGSGRSFAFSCHLARHWLHAVAPLPVRLLSEEASDAFRKDGRVRLLDRCNGGGDLILKAGLAQRSVMAVRTLASMRSSSSASSTVAGGTSLSKAAILLSSHWMNSGVDMAFSSTRLVCSHSAQLPSGSPPGCSVTYSATGLRRSPALKVSTSNPIASASHGSKPKLMILILRAPRAFVALWNVS